MSIGKGLAQESRQLALGKPAAVVDLRSDTGSRWLKTKWYVQPAAIINSGFRQPGPGPNDPLKLYPTGKINTTHRLKPSLGDPGFEKDYMAIRPGDLENREGMGLVSFVWFRVELTIPEKLGNWVTAGAAAVFEITVDDYSEVWVNGRQSTAFGQSGAGAIPGYNARNRVVLTPNARAGDSFTIDVLGINGPLGKIPDNYIWVRNATVDFYPSLPRPNAGDGDGKIFTIDMALNRIIDPASGIRKIADGFQFTEGPVWHPDGYLLFSDPNANCIYRYSPDDGNVGIFMSHSGYSGIDIGRYGQPGSNGLAIDREGRLLIDQHGNRRVIRMEKKGPVTILADRYRGKRLNSPNDIVIRSDGSVYFTDPPYGLPGFFSDPSKELDFSGVFMVKDGKLSLVSQDLGGPNGLAFSPDEKYLYVTNWDIRDIHHTKTIWRYEVAADGTLSNGKILCDFNFTEDEEALDGIKVDQEGNLFVSAPGGVWIMNSEGRILGKLVMPERPANMAWGDADGKTLYMTAHHSLFALRVLTGGKFSWQ